jgi:hypothetical protein
MITLRLVLACLLVSLSLSTATADQKDDTGKVGGLLKHCKEELGSPNRMHCIGYISAVWDVLTVASADDIQVDRAFAVCGRVKYGAMVQAFVNWAEKHPERWEKPRSLGVALALGGLWPCK